MNGHPYDRRFVAPLVRRWDTAARRHQTLLVGALALGTFLCAVIVHLWMHVWLDADDPLVGMLALASAFVGTALLGVCLWYGNNAMRVVVMLPGLVVARIAIWFIAQLLTRTILPYVKDLIVEWLA